jgi:hypothetical protein
MKKEIVVNEKQLVIRLEKAEMRVDKSLKSFVDDCINLGEELIDIKKIIGHGGWESFLNRNSSFRFATSRQASKFIRIAENKIFAKTFAIGINSIDGIDKLIAGATPEQIAEAKKIEIEQEAKRQQDEAEKIRKAAELETKKAETKANEPDIIEGEFKEVKVDAVIPEAKPEPEPTMEEQLTIMVEDLQAMNEELQKDNDSMVKIFEENDQLKAALNELKRVNELNRVLEERVRGLQNERNEMVRSVKYWKVRFEKLEKELSHDK